MLHPSLKEQRKILHRCSVRSAVANSAGQRVKNYEFPMVPSAASFAIAALGARFISLDHTIYGGGGRFARKLKD
jgi:hypothetical protein